MIADNILKLRLITVLLSGIVMVCFPLLGQDKEKQSEKTQANPTAIDNATDDGTSQQKKISTRPLSRNNDSRNIAPPPTDYSVLAYFIVFGIVTVVVAFIVIKNKRDRNRLL